MKKIIIATMSLFVIMTFASMASAAGVNTTTSGGATLTVVGGATAGPSLTFTPSPSTLMSCFTSPTGFTAIAASSKTTGGAGGNGIEYGIVSSTSAMYQQVQATTGQVTATTSDTGLPGAFKTKSGSDAPAAS